MTGGAGRDPTKQAPALLARLHRLRNLYTAQSARELRTLLRQFAPLRLRKWAHLAQLHDDLLFIAAFPASPAARRQARSMLRSMSQRMEALPRKERRLGDDSGIAGSTTRNAYPFPVARLLGRAEAAEIDWPRVEDEAALDPVIATRLAPAAREAFESGEYGTREFVALARPATAGSDLRWLTEDPRAAEAWDAAEVPVAWNLGDSRRSVTRNALAVAAPVARTAMRRPDGDTVALIAAPLPGIERLSRRDASRLVDCARAALAARCREVDAITWPNVDEVWWCDLGCGVALAVVGIAREKRLSLETNTGYVLLANGIPIGYGGVTPLFRQANTGINVFDPFRGSEAAFLWTQMLRAFHTLYGSTRFVVNAYQFGAGNAEAIRSGAFWFYHRLGFRPSDAGVAAQAAREARRIAADRRHRSDARTLRALASCDLHLDLAGYDPRDFFDESLIARAGARAARRLALNPDAANALAQELGIADLAHWGPAERRGLQALAPIFQGLAIAGDGERDALAAMLRAKALPQERDFALRSLGARGAFRALAAALDSNRAT